MRRPLITAAALTVIAMTFALWVRGTFSRSSTIRVVQARMPKCLTTKPDIAAHRPFAGTNRSPHASANAQSRQHESHP